MLVLVELYGVARLRAGSGLIRVEASTIEQALREIGRVCPALEDSVLRQGTLRDSFQLSLNGERFVSDPQTPLREGDVLLLLSVDAGG